ncbi:HK97-gp10 family putative phage morphogenesis protein [Ketogulonicigenium vulgare]|uniref:HK97-gp10 family putative phage morphogenesis protein n=1 Tax=Ketogulonicigenium vulgare TaxID=92945 RepID=UPI00235945A0|nr:HK97-gp10 family putative phage morphogenesis protein [Ketogulonicigenium vulgare]
MARNGVKLEGFEGLSANLKNLEKASTRTSAVRSAMRKAAKPVIESAKSNVAVDSGALRDSIGIGSTLNKSQRRQAKASKEKGAVTQYLGSGGKGARHSHLVEFGTVDQPARPFLRPAWDSGKDQYLKDLSTEMQKHITKALKRQERRRNGN